MTESSTSCWRRKLNERCPSPYSTARLGPAKLHHERQEGLRGKEPGHYFRTWKRDRPGLLGQPEQLQVHRRLQGLWRPERQDDLSAADGPPRPGGHLHHHHLLRDPLSRQGDGLSFPDPGPPALHPPAEDNGIDRDQFLGHALSLPACDGGLRCPRKRAAALLRGDGLGNVPFRSLFRMPRRAPGDHLGPLVQATLSEDAAGGSPGRPDHAELALPAFL